VLLIVATLDKVPDPPAANPNNAQASAYCMVEHGIAAVPFHAPVGVQPATGLAQTIAFERTPTFPDSNLLLRMERASDPSPPTLI